MLDLIMQHRPSPIFSLPAYSAQLYGIVLLVFVLGGLTIFGMTQLPTRARRPIIWLATFMAGLFYVVYWIWPTPISRKPEDAARDLGEGVSFWLNDALPRVADTAQILTAFLLGLGIFSLLRIHIKKLTKKQQDWQFSAVLLGSMVTMTAFGYWDWSLRFHDKAGLFLDRKNWQVANYGYDLLFDGFFQNMDSAMFSMIAFYILSAAYRAFRIRSVESTVLMTSALILMLGLMGALVFFWDKTVSDSLIRMTGWEQFRNVRIEFIGTWLQKFMQTPSLRAIEFGVGLGALAMGLRIWLGLERGGVTS